MIHPNVSVVVPTRNRRALLTMTLRSVLRQQDVELEVIVVDEASTDDTLAVLGGLGDDRVRVVHHETARGVSAARNRGADEAHGDWIAFLDDDDLWAPDKLARQLQAAQKAGCDWAYSGSVSITDPTHIVYGRPPLAAEQMIAALLRYNAIPGGGSNVIVRRQTWRQVGPFDTRLRNTEDWEMWIRLAKHGAPACVCRPSIGYRVHAANSSLDIAEIVRGTRLIEALHHTSADWGRMHRWLAESCLRRGQRRDAIGQFAKAAVHGAAPEVIADLGAILRQRVARRIPALRSAGTLARDPWIASAAEWLCDLDRAAAPIRAAANLSAALPYE